MEENQNMNDGRLIFNAGVAKSLLAAGCVIIGIKQSKENPDKTIFAFKNDAHFRAEFKRIMNEIASVRTTGVE